MKKIVYLLIACSLTTISCNKDNDVASVNMEVKSNEREVKSNEYDIALDLVKNFTNREHKVSTYSKKRDLSNITVLNVKENTFTYNVDEILVGKVLTEEQRTSVEKTRNEKNTTDVTLFTIEFEKNGSKGFAITSGDERITNVYAYTEEGSLADTSYILGLRAAIYDIQGAVRADLDSYYENGENIRMRNDIQLIETNKSGKVNTRHTTYPVQSGRLYAGPITKLKWNQNSPYNKYAPSCTAMHWTYEGKAPSGCVGIACAQVIAFLCPPAISGNYYLNSLREQYTFIEGTTNQSWADNLGGFIRNVATMVNTQYGCDGSSAKIKNIRDEFSSWGVYHTYVDGNLDLAKMAYNFMNGYPHITEGVNKGTNKGHAWVWEGIDCQVSYIDYNAKKIVISGSALVYCNWGWGGTCNGWFANYEDVTLPDGTYKRYIEDNEQIYITGTSFVIP